MRLLGARPGRTAAEIATVLIAAAVAFPLYWMVLAAIKPESEVIASDPKPWTLKPSFDSFGRVLTVEGFGRYFLNSVVVAVLVVALSLFISFSRRPR